MADLQKVWVMAEKTGMLAQLCGGARELGAEVSAIVLGSKEDGEKAIELGADQVYWLGIPDKELMLEDYVPTLYKQIKEEKPELLMIQSGRRGKLIAGRLAALLGTSVMVDTSSVEIVEGKVQMTHMVYGGAALRTERSQAPTAIITVGNGVFNSAAEDAGRTGEIKELDFVPPIHKIKVLERKAKTASAVHLDAAKRVVGIGRGLADQKDLEMVEQLAQSLQAEIGCSRPLAEGLNWLPRERYIGVSGVILKPELYFAVGISGEIQHMVGVNQAKVIVAVNKDKNAPIFQQADYGIVGDLYKILPLLTEKAKANG